jgi:vacuolar-type H+-ATPase subunit F/Vma7
MSRLVIVVPDSLAAGFRLAGTSVVTSEDTEEALAAVEALSEDDDVGVIGLFEPYYEAADEALRLKLRAQAHPVVVGVPSGLGQTARGDGRGRLAALLEEAVGLKVTFRGEEG